MKQKQKDRHIGLYSFMVRLPPQEKAWLERMCLEDDRAKSNLMRWLVRKDAKRRGWTNAEELVDG